MTSRPFAQAASGDVNKEDEEDGVEHEDDTGMVE